MCPAEYLYDKAACLLAPHFFWAINRGPRVTVLYFSVAPQLLPSTLLSPVLRLYWTHWDKNHGTHEVLLSVQRARSEAFNIYLTYPTHVKYVQHGSKYIEIARNNSLVPIVMHKMRGGGFSYHSLYAQGDLEPLRASLPCLGSNRGSETQSIDNSLQPLVEMAHGFLRDCQVMKSRPGCRHHIPGSPFSTALSVLAQCSNFPTWDRRPLDSRSRVHGSSWEWEPFDLKMFSFPCTVEEGSCPQGKPL